MLDVARRLLLVEIAGGVEVSRSEVELGEITVPARARRIRELGVQVLICGAVSWPLEAMLASAGMQVIPQTCGGVDEVLGAFLSGGLAGGGFLMPGCCGRRRRFRGGRRLGGPAGLRGWGPRP